MCWTNLLHITAVTYRLILNFTFVGLNNSITEPGKWKDIQVSVNRLKYPNYRHQAGNSVKYILDQETYIFFQMEEHPTLVFRCQIIWEPGDLFSWAAICSSSVTGYVLVINNLSVKFIRALTFDPAEYKECMVTEYDYAANLRILWAYFHNYIVFTLSYSSYSVVLHFVFFFSNSWQGRLCPSGWRLSLRIQLNDWKILDLYNSDQEVAIMLNVFIS